MNNMKTNRYRTHYCGRLTEQEINKKVKVSVWIESVRDHGGVLFLDLRDETGIIQLVSNDDRIFEGLTKESTITVEGLLRKRDEDDYNLKTYNRDN
jgi:aspartyl-tRNA synthetase